MEESNVLDIEEKIQELAKENSTPLQVYIELLTKCNWRCKHCYIPDYSDEGLSKDTIFNIFDQLKNMGIFEIIITGGEIFCRKDIMEILRKARSMYFKVRLRTNVSLLNEEKIKELADIYIAGIGCTIFSLDENTHDSITGVKGSLKLALKNMMLIKKYNIPLEVKTGITKINHTAYKDVEEFCNKNGFEFKPYYDISSKTNKDSSTHDFRMSQKQLEEVLEDVDRIEHISNREHSNEEYVCETLRYLFFINSKGDVYPCFRFFYKIGNIYESSLEDIWNCKGMLKEIRELKWGDLNECKSCKNSKYCSRCAGMTYLEDNTILGKSSFACSIANTRSKLYSNKYDKRLKSS